MISFFQKNNHQKSKMVFVSFIIFLVCALDVQFIYADSLYPGSVPYGDDYGNLQYLFIQNGQFKISIGPSSFSDPAGYRFAVGEDIKVYALCQTNGENNYTTSSITLVTSSGETALCSSIKNPNASNVNVDERTTYLEMASNFGVSRKLLFKICYGTQCAMKTLQYTPDVNYLN